MVNALTLAVVVPTVVIRPTAEILFGVPVNLIAGQERIPLWAAALVMITSYVLWLYGIEGTFVR